MSRVPTLVQAVLLLAVLYTAAVAAAADEIERGRYLARIGNCAGCHTAPGGEPYAGGLALHSALGTFYTPNITPDPETGIGTWSGEAFRAALHRGERPDGSSLYPACPYPSLTRLTRKDVDAIHAYLRSLMPVHSPTPAHRLDFPFGYRWLLGVWKALYFEPGSYRARPAHGAAWNRGAYLVEGLGHCNECHRRRNFLGAVSQTPGDGGGRVHGWYAPSLNNPREAGLQGLEREAAAAFLRTGKRERAVMMGPMAGVVFHSLQYLTAADARAMAVYLTSLPEVRDRGAPAPVVKPGDGKYRQGRAVYRERCGDCHGESGEGSAGVVALAGNPGVVVDDPTNPIRVIRRGGFPASVPGHPRPHGMPPQYDLSDREIAAVATYIRQSWGHNAAAVRTFQVRQ